MCKSKNALNSVNKTRNVEDDDRQTTMNGDVVGGLHLDVLRIVVRRRCESATLGLTVRGGCPVEVRRVADDGAAKVGGLRVGDRIIVVDDVDVRCWNTADIATLLKNIWKDVGEVRFTVQRPTERRHRGVDGSSRRRSMSSAYEMVSCPNIDDGKRYVEGRSPIADQSESSRRHASDWNDGGATFDQPNDSTPTSCRQDRVLRRVRGRLTFCRLRRTTTDGGRTRWTAVRGRYHTRLYGEVDRSTSVESAAADVDESRMSDLTTITKYSGVFHQIIDDRTGWNTGIDDLVATTTARTVSSCLVPTNFSDDTVECRPLCSGSGSSGVDTSSPSTTIWSAGSRRSSSGFDGTFLSPVQSTSPDSSSSSMEHDASPSSERVCSYFDSKVSSSEHEFIDRLDCSEQSSNEEDLVIRNLLLTIKSFIRTTKLGVEHVAKPLQSILTEKQHSKLFQSFEAVSCLSFITQTGILT